MKTTNDCIKAMYVSDNNDKLSRTSSVFQQLRNDNWMDYKQYGACKVSITTFAQYPLTIKELVELTTAIHTLLRPDVNLIWEHNVYDGEKGNELMLTVKLW